MDICGFAIFLPCVMDGPCVPLAEPVEAGWIVEPVALIEANETRRASG